MYVTGAKLGYQILDVWVIDAVVLISTLSPFEPVFAQTCFLGSKCLLISFDVLPTSPPSPPIGRIGACYGLPQENNEVYLRIVFINPLHDFR